MINQHALEAIRASELSGANIAELLERMAAETEQIGSSGGLFILSYLDPDQLPEEGELVPTITLALKPFSLKQKPNLYVE